MAKYPSFLTYSFLLNIVVVNCSLALWPNETPGRNLKGNVLVPLLTSFRTAATCTHLLHHPWLPSQYFGSLRSFFPSYFVSIFHFQIIITIHNHACNAMKIKYQVTRRILVCLFPVSCNPNFSMKLCQKWTTVLMELRHDLTNFKQW